MCHISQYFPIPPIITSHQSSFSNRSSHLFLALLLPHVMVTLLPTIPLHFWLFFSSFFHTLRLQFLHSFLSLLTLLLLIILHFSVTIPPTLPLPFWLFISSSYFLSHLTITLLPTIPLPIRLCFFPLFYTLLLQFVQLFLSLFYSSSPHIFFFLKKNLYYFFYTSLFFI